MKTEIAILEITHDNNETIDKDDILENIQEAVMEILPNSLLNVYIDNRIIIDYPYKDLENIPDSTRGDCPSCPKGYLSIDLKKSFKICCYEKEFTFDVVVCDRCNYVRLEKWISESDKITKESD